jgi:hypothetical protein
MKSKMKTYQFAWVVGLLVLSASWASAQTTKVCKGETVCHTVGTHRGFVQWEQSSDGLNWSLVPFMSQDTFCMTADSNGYYRAAISEGSCAPIYTEVRHIEAIVVTVDAGVDGLTCGGGTTTLGGSPTASGGVNPMTYVWSPATGLSSTSDPNPVATPLNTTVYTVVVTDSLGCMGTDSILIAVQPGVIADAGADALVCIGGSRVIGGSPAGSGGTGPLSYLWSPATDLSSAIVPNPAASNTVSTTYVLTVTDSVGCADTDTVVVDTTSGPVSGNQTFTYTGAVETWVVPNCVDSITMDVYGAQGGANWVNNTNLGGRVTAKLAVTTGETLYIYVGQQPTAGTAAGWNGGGAGDGAGKGGGGGTDVRRGAGTLNDRIIVAGGGGGAGYWSSLHVVGGPGGGLVGGDGYRDPSYASNPGGLGATQTAGGATGTCINLYVTTMAGSFGQGGTPLGYSCGCEGYGGGGGWYGGAGSGNCRGAGGGSSYTIPGATNVVHQQGARAGNGQVIFTW